VIIAFPTAFQVNGAKHPNVPQQIFSQRAGAAGIAFIDLLPIYQQACDQRGVKACEGYEDNHLFADVWMHPNVLGHRLAAEAIYDWQR
jgi:hypothetical protein